MKPFLQQVAQHYLEASGLEDYCFVFPNRRSGQFFSHYLQQELVAADKRERKVVPHLMPRVTSINDLVAELTSTVAATDIEMIFALYDAYCLAMGDKAQEFDKFIYWAQLIISDFNIEIIPGPWLGRYIYSLSDPVKIVILFAPQRLRKIFLCADNDFGAHLVFAGCFHHFPAALYFRIRKTYRVFDSIYFYIYDFHTFYP